MSANSAVSLRSRFFELHAHGIFVMPNPWDIGSARILVSLGFPALATTSSGHAASLGRLDTHVAFEELLAHASSIADAVDVPLNVDSERLFADTPDAVAANVHLIAATGAAGCSIEDWDPAVQMIDPLGKAVERVAAAAEAAHAHGMVLTGRAENHIHGLNDLADTITRLQAYHAAGADAVYAPGLIRPDDIARVVDEVDAPVNVLALRGGPSVSELRAIGVRRVSTGGALAMAAYGALVRGGRELLESGTSDYSAERINGSELSAAFGTA